MRNSNQTRKPLAIRPSRRLRSLGRICAGSDRQSQGKTFGRRWKVAGGWGRGGHVFSPLFFFSCFFCLFYLVVCFGVGFWFFVCLSLFGCDSSLVFACVCLGCFVCFFGKCWVLWRSLPLRRSEAPALRMKQWNLFNIPICLKTFKLKFCGRIRHVMAWTWLFAKERDFS